MCINTIQKQNPLYRLIMKRRMPDSLWMGKPDMPEGLLGDSVKVKLGQVALSLLPPLAIHFRSEIPKLHPFSFNLLYFDLWLRARK